MRERTDVDVNLDQREAGWEFDDAVADEFDSHVRKSIPNYDTIQNQVVKLTDWFSKASRSDTFYDLGCATGETIERLVQHHRGTETEFVGIDIEEAMLSKARERLNVHDSVRLVNQDLTDPPAFENATVITSLFTMSFIPEGERRELIERIHHDLETGGAFIFVEKTRAQSGHFQDIWNEHYWDFKQSRGLDPEQILGKADTLRGQLRPLTTDEYRSMLTDAGFETTKVGQFYKWLPWTGVLAKK
jgi:tRNA (cmo5U34)-methyltransferase